MPVRWSGGGRRLWRSPQVTAAGRDASRLAPVARLKAAIATAAMDEPRGAPGAASKACIRAELDASKVRRDQRTGRAGDAETAETKRDRRRVKELDLPPRQGVAENAAFLVESK